MQLFTSKEVGAIDRQTMSDLCISSWELMEHAASKCCSWIVNRYTRSYKVNVFCGFGNNGGDGFAIGRQLQALDYKVEVYYCLDGAKQTADNLRNIELAKANSVKLFCISSEVDFPYIGKDEIVVDALFGAGLSRPIEGITEKLIQWLNGQKCERIAIDVPSGVPGEGVVGKSTALKANYTLTFQFPFLSFFLQENAEYINEWHVLDISLSKTAMNAISSKYFLTETVDVEIKERSEFGHKGTFGHALIIAGSKGMAGAAVLSAKACLRSGTGKVTVHLPDELANIMQVSFPEAILSIDKNNKYVAKLPDIANYQAIAIGPGLGVHSETYKLVKELLTVSAKPLVIDADALNLIATHPELLGFIPKNSILTPHPLEFERLFGKTENSYQRLLLQQKKSIQYNIIIVLKGRYTSIALPSGVVYFNGTGNSGMATAGSGDVLTGIIVSLLAQAYDPVRAAISGVFLHGMAGDCAAEVIEKESMIASDVIEYISSAIKKCKMFSSNLRF